MSKDKNLNACPAGPQPLSIQAMLAIKGGNGNAGQPPLPPPPVVGQDDTILQ